MGNWDNFTYNNWGNNPEPTDTASVVAAGGGGNSSPLDRGIPKGVGLVGRKGEIIVGIDHFGGIKTTDGRSSVTLVLGFQDTDLGGAAELVWLKADDQFIFRAQAPTRAPTGPFVVYDGTQTEVDPTILDALGALETTMWPGLAYIVMKDFDLSPFSETGDVIPNFFAAWTTDATVAGGGTTTTAVTGGAWSGVFDASMAIDYTTNRGYLWVYANPSEAYVVTVDLTTEAEISRVQLDPALGPYGYSFGMVSLQGTDFVVVECFTQIVQPGDSDIGGLRLINARTGEVLADLDAVHRLSGASDGYWEPGVIGSVLLESGAATKYLVFCFDFASLGIFPSEVNATDGMIALADITNGTLEWIVHPDFAPLKTASGQETVDHMVVSEVFNGRATVFFYSQNDRTVYRVFVTASGVSGLTAIYTDGTSDIAGIAYDQIDNAIIVSTIDVRIIKYDLDTSMVVYDVSRSSDTGGPTLWMNPYNSDSSATGDASKPGFGVGYSAGANKLWLVDFSDGSITALNSSFIDFMYFDQYRGKVYDPAAVGTIRILALGDLNPNSIDLQDIITSLMIYNGDYIAGDLSFTNFTGGEVEGLDVSSDTTIDALLRDVTSLNSVREVHDAGKVKFSIPTRDGAFAVDVTLDNNHIVDSGIRQEIDDLDVAYERTIVSFGNVDADFAKTPQEFARPNGEYEVLKSNKRRNVSTSLTMTAPQAAKLANRITYESDLDHKTYRLAIMPSQFKIEPSTVIQFPYGPNDEFTIVAEVRRATLNNDLSQEIEASEALQDVLTTFSGSPLVVVPVAPEIAPAALTILDTALLTWGDDLGQSGLRGYAILHGTGTDNISNSRLFLSENGIDYAASGSRSGISPIGGYITTLGSTLPDDFQTDFLNTLTVRITGGDVSLMASTDEPGRYSLVNYAVIGQRGRWVLISYEDISVSGQSVVLSNIIWGMKGTEVYLDQLKVNDQFHNLEPNEVLKFSSSTAILNADLYYKGGYSGWSLLSLPTVKNLADGEAEKPYAPVDLAGVDNAGDVDMSCGYRERLDPLPVLTGFKSAGYSDGTDFEWDIMDGSTVKRTLTSATNSVTYSSANFIADFGSPVPATLTYRAYHMSGLGFRGHRAEATVTP